MPRIQQELSRLQFQRDFLEAQARYDFQEPEDDEQQATTAYADDLAVHFYFVCRE